MCFLNVPSSMPFLHAVYHCHLNYDIPELSREGTGIWLKNSTEIRTKMIIVGKGTENWDCWEEWGTKILISADL